MNSKLLIFFCITLILLGMFGFGVLFNNHKISSVDSHKPIPVNQFSKPSQVICDIVFTRYEEGKKTFLIKADKISIQRKKVGFFRFGLLSEAVADNAVIQIFTRHTSSKNESKPEFDQSVFSQTMPFVRSKRITSFIMKPVTVEFYEDQSLVTRISSNSAVLSLTKQEILFKGKVRVVSD